ncbi:decarboxylating 6-phosphogluconate dehydrogenase [Roseomonas sp. NAR14]|uniref:Decarboxylating 6-phosphogluconate dehydrogenase n=1 Tax=Roseomonas acroporae TaxID=2937791 RepID=A0A9X1Y5C2_9PROT|nr:decarboxylating 6-phosphogluconate dehydrogenase [Roseomonas acroporae]MCK8783593.1 decarboxylating 6-phosphogluconate dehydrogenase [Roseomonas acroporae]
MRIGIIGLGRMGGNIARRLMRAGHECVALDRSAEAVKALAADGAEPAADVAALLAKLPQPQVVWVMLPSGEITEAMVAELAGAMRPGGVVIDGGNSFWKDDVRRGRELRAKGLHYVDVGTSGGVWGLERGYCMMIGGDEETVRMLDPILAALAPGAGEVTRTPGREGRDPRAEQGYIHAGPVGAGHFVKMVHNGIEYGMMQAFAEGFEIMRTRGDGALPEGERFDLDLADIAEVWRRGSVVSSWLLDLTAIALAGDPKLDAYGGNVADSGEGRWTIQAAIEQAVPANVLSAALYARFRSRQEHPFGEKLLSAMRFQFGGHVETKPG